MALGVAAIYAPAEMEAIFVLAAASAAMKTAVETKSGCHLRRRSSHPRRHPLSAFCAAHERRLDQNVDGVGDGVLALKRPRLVFRRRRRSAGLGLAVLATRFLPPTLPN